MLLRQLGREYDRVDGGSSRLQLGRLARVAPGVVLRSLSHHNRRMCGRYASFLGAEFIARLFATVNPLPNLAPTWNGCGANLRYAPMRIVCAELPSGFQYRIPDCGRSSALNSKTPQAELSLTDAVHQFDAGDRDHCSCGIA